MQNIYFIINIHNELYADECINYINHLHVPEDVVMDTITVADCDDNFEAYEAVRKELNGGIQIYLKETTRIIYKDFLNDVLSLFATNFYNAYGIVGYMGNNVVGKQIFENQGRTLLFNKHIGTMKVQLLSDDIIICDGTIPFGRNITDYCMRANVAVGNQFKTWCRINSYDINYPISKLLNRLEYDIPLNDDERSFLKECVRKGNGDLNRVYFKRKVTYYLSQIMHNRVFAIPNGKVDVSKTMNIVTSLNRKWLPMVATLLESIYIHNNVIPIRVFLLSNELTEEDLHYYDSLIKDRNISIELITINNDLLDKFPVKGIWTIESLYRLKMLELLPLDVDRVLYIDGDTIVTNQIYDFYFDSFDGNDIVAALDFDEELVFEDDRSHLFTQYKDDPNFGYINNGVMVMNIEKLRHEITFDTFLNVATQLDFQLPFLDQDLINLVFADKIKIVSPIRYNLPAAYRNFELEETINSAAIIHYMSIPKPWIKTHMKNAITDIWWNYAKRVGGIEEM